MLIYTVNLLFTTYTFMLLARVLGSWFPRFAQSRIMQFVGFYTDPYLNVFKRIIPPLGMMDFSPMVAFIALRLAQTFFLSFFR